jgi:hypothetical protein
VISCHSQHLRANRAESVRACAKRFDQAQREHLLELALQVGRGRVAEESARAHAQQDLELVLVEDGYSTSVAWAAGGAVRNGWFWAV